MNDIPRHAVFSFAQADEQMETWAKLEALAAMIDINISRGTLTIHNGKSRIVLGADGVIRVEGERIVQSARRNIALDAATIDLN